MNTFYPDSFRKPSKENSMIYVWAWNSPITQDSVDRQLTEYAACGIRGLYILPLPSAFRPDTMQTFLQPDYLTEKYFTMVRYALSKAKDLGMECWLYDEGGWPSGGACGNTAKTNPDAVETVIQQREVILNKGEIYTLKKDVYPFIDKQRITEPFRAKERTVVTEYYFRELQIASRNHVDTTNPDVTDTFISNTYEAHYRHLKPMFGRDITLFFTDEPSVIPKLIPKNFIEKFKAVYHYDITDYLPVLTDADAATTEKRKQARIDYGRLIGELFYENYCKRIARWCSEHEIRFGGHLDLDHIPDGGARQMYFSHLHALSAFDVPGIDVITHQIRYPRNGATPTTQASPFFPRIASSAARQSGKKLALTETFAVYGDAVTQDEMRYVLNYQAIRGINVFNIFSLSSNDHGFSAMTERPVFTPKKPGFYHLQNFNTYYARLSYLLRLGEAVCDTALYQPCADFWANSRICKEACKNYDQAGTELEQNNVCFEIVDDYALEQAQPTPDGLQIGDAVYQHIKVPVCRYMPEDLRTKISPYLTESQPILAVKNKNLRVMKRKLKNAMLWFIFNEGEQKAEEILQIPTDNLYELQLQSGEIYRAEKAHISLVCGEMAVFLESEETLPCDSRETEYSIPITGFRPVRAKRFTICRNGIDMTDTDVSCITDRDFSGEITYTAHYALPNEPKAEERYRLVLEDTSVTASAYFDGKKAADFGLSPMFAIISGADLNQNGQLELTVANTAADEIIAKSEEINSYPAAVTGPYHAVSLEFEQNRPPLKPGRVRIEKIK